MSGQERRKAPGFVDWFRLASPYIHAHRGRTFVLAIDGEAVAAESFSSLVHDIAILHGLGIRLVLVHGARPQIDERLRERGAELRIVGGLRVTDDAALNCVKEAAGAVRVELEARLSMGVANSPMAGVRIRTASGNLVTAKPLGVRNGVDFGHTGEVRRVDAEGIRRQLDAGAIVLVPALGYSPTGEVFNLSAPEVAAAVAGAIGADKLIALLESGAVRDTRRRPISHLLPVEVDRMLRRRRLPEELRQQLHAAVNACRHGVARVHLLDRRLDGGLLRELFTREGVGTLLTAAPYETMRGARIDDVGGLLELLRPFEEEGILVRRSRERLETEIDHFTLIERDGMVIGCAALYPSPGEPVAELACVAVHPDYRTEGRGDRLLAHMEHEARRRRIDRLFVLTTHSSQWFQERGYLPRTLRSLPVERQALYNYRRNSKILVKPLDGG